jgi:hypothetical protein
MPPVVVQTAGSWHGADGMRPLILSQLHAGDAVTARRPGPRQTPCAAGPAGAGSGAAMPGRPCRWLFAAGCVIGDSPAVFDRARELMFAAVSFVQGADQPGALAVAGEAVRAGRVAALARSLVRAADSGVDWC